MTFPYVNPLAIDITQAEGLRYVYGQWIYVQVKARGVAPCHALHPKTVYWPWAKPMAYYFSPMARGEAPGLLTSRQGLCPWLMRLRPCPLQGAGPLAD